MTHEEIVALWREHQEVHSFARALMKREWVGLTDEEIKQIAIDTPIDGIRFARELEAKLKEKNI
jgi:hypothetical protein